MRCVVSEFHNDGTLDGDVIAAENVRAIAELIASQHLVKVCDDRIPGQRPKE
jgi:hypothetical protein